MEIAAVLVEAQVATQAERKLVVLAPQIKVMQVAIHLVVLAVVDMEAAVAAQDKPDRLEPRQLPASAEMVFRRLLQVHLLHAVVVAVLAAMGQVPWVVQAVAVMDVEERQQEMAYQTQAVVAVLEAM